MCSVHEAASVMCSVSLPMLGLVFFVVFCGILRKKNVLKFNVVY